MSWKYAEPHWSLTNRIAALYTLLGSGLFVVLAGALYWGLLTTFDQEDAGFLQARLDDVLSQLKLIESRPAVLEEIRARGTENAMRGQFVRVLDGRRQILAETPGMDRMLAGPALSAITSENLPGRVHEAQISGRRYLLAAGMVDDASDKLIVLMAIDTSRDDIILRRIREFFLAATLMSIAATAAVGWWVARRGLLPLEDMARAARRITAQQLHSRLVPEQWPTELRALASEFDLMLRRLDDSFSRLTRFSADLAHELRTPIHNLRGEADVALMQARSAGEYRQVLESALEEYDRLNRLIQGLLFLARADHHQMMIESKWIDLAEEFACLALYFQPLADERGVTICVDARQARIQADPMLLRQLLSNLISNALDHTPAGGSIAVRTDGAAIEVSDTGAGIAPEHLPHIFERFFRAGTARSRSGDSGSGLGLAIAQSILRLHGGAISVSSEVGAGSTFRLQFPAASFAR